MATSTIFTDVEAVRIVLFVFHCSVIAFFAVITRQSDDHAIVFLSHGLYSRKCPEKKDLFRGACGSISNDEKPCQLI